MEMIPNTIDFNSLSKKQLVELVIAKYNDNFAEISFDYVPADSLYTEFLGKK